MTRHGLRGGQQLSAEVLAQVDLLVRRQQRHGGLVAAANGNKAVHKVLPAFLQIDAPLAERSRQFAIVAVHRRIVSIVVRQTQVIHLIGELVHLQNDAVEINLRHGGEAGDIFGNRPARGNQTGVVHVREAGIRAFQQSRGSGYVLVAPQLAPGQLHQEIGLGQQPGF